MSDHSRRFPLMDGRSASPPKPTYSSRWAVIAFAGPIIGALVFVVLLALMLDVGFDELEWSNVTFVFAVVWALGHVPAAIAATTWHFVKPRVRWARLALAVLIGGVSSATCGAAMMIFFFGFGGSPLQLTVLFGIGATSLALTALPFASPQMEA